MAKPKTIPSPRTLEAVLQMAVASALEGFGPDRLDGPVAMCRVAHAIFAVGLDVLICGSADATTCRVQMERALATKFEIEAKTKPIVERGTIGSVLMSRAKA